MNNFESKCLCFSTISKNNTLKPVKNSRLNRLQFLVRSQKKILIYIFLSKWWRTLFPKNVLNIGGHKSVIVFRNRMTNILASQKFYKLHTLAAFVPKFVTKIQNKQNSSWSMKFRVMTRKKNGEEKIRIVCVESPLRSKGMRDDGMHNLHVLWNFITTADIPSIRVTRLFVNCIRMNWYSWF